MIKPISIDRRGTLTLPKPMRRHLALSDEGGLLIAEETAEGILLRPGTVVPAVLYTEEDVAGYRVADEELRALLPKLKKVARKSRPR